MVKVLVTPLCPTLCDPIYCSSPGSSIHGIPPGKNTGVGCHSLLQGIFWTQGLKLDIPHCNSRFFTIWATREALGNPLQYSCLENATDRGAWQAIVHKVMKSKTRWSDLACMHVWWRKSWGKSGCQVRDMMDEELWWWEREWGTWDSKLKEAFTLRVMWALGSNPRGGHPLTFWPYDGLDIGSEGGHQNLNLF